MVNTQLILQVPVAYEKGKNLFPAIYTADDVVLLVNGQAL